MGTDLWQLSAPWWQFILRGLVVFAMVPLFLRFSGERQIGRMTPFDLVLLLLISNAVQNSMNGGDHSITAGAILASILIGRHRRKVEVILEGRAELLAHNGHVRADALRAHDCADVSEVHAAILETDGHISVLTRKERR